MHGDWPKVPRRILKLHGIVEPEWRAGERLVLHGYAAFVEGPSPSRGYLWLSTRRLLYASSLQNIHTIFRSRPCVEIGLDEIESIGSRSRLWGFFGGFGQLFPVFTVTLKDGCRLAFQTYRVGLWRQEIGARLAVAESTETTTRSSS